MTFHIYSKYLSLAFPFPFATHEAAEKHLATFTYPDNFGITERRVRVETEARRLDREDIEFENDAEVRDDELVRAIERSEDWKWGGS